MRVLYLILFGAVAVLGLGRALELIFFVGSFGPAIIPGALGLVCAARFFQVWKNK